MNPRFSVIIPLYNKAPYVAKAINSVLTQTFANYELIIVDDGSEDNSAEVAAQCIGKYDKCQLIKQVNAGVSMARNNGVDVSNGDYLCFLDADDWWSPTFLEEMSKLIDAYPDAGVYGSNYTIVNEAKKRTRIARIGVEERFEKGYINYCQVYAKTMYMPLWTGAVCVPRNIFKEMMGFQNGIKLGEDFLLWIRIALKYKVAFLNQPLAFYNQDVDTTNRAVYKLFMPSEHMLWNLEFLKEEESTNPDYKHLVDNLRINGLYQYYISDAYHNVALKELSKINWTTQTRNVYKKYHRPIWIERFRYRLSQMGASVKTYIKSLL